MAIETLRRWESKPPLTRSDALSAPFNDPNATSEPLSALMKTAALLKAAGDARAIRQTLREHAGADFSACVAAAANPEAVDELLLGLERDIAVAKGSVMAIDAQWVMKIASDSGNPLREDDAAEIAQYAAENLWDSELIGAICAEQIRSEIEGFLEYREDRRNQDEARTDAQSTLKAKR